MDRQREREIDAEVDAAGWLGLFLLLLGFVVISALKLIHTGALVISWP